MLNIYEAQAVNKRKSFVIVFLFALFVAGVTYVLAQAFGYYNNYTPGGFGIVGLALIVSGLMSFISYYFSDSIVLSLSGARQANRKRDFDFYTVVENLSIGAGIPKPKLYVIEDSAPNAFACGRNPQHCSVCATTGLLEKLNRSELEGVMAHELSHIKNYDTLLATLITVMVGLVVLLGDWFLRSSFRSRRSENNNQEGGLGAIFILLGFVFAILSPIIAQLMQLAISRRREFGADAGSVAITKQPKGLISALEKISQDKEPLEAANKATAHLYIVNPFKNKGNRVVGNLSNLFNTHPPIEARIKALQSMS